MANLLSVGGGEAFGTFTGDFEGKPAFLVDCSTMNEFLDADDQIAEPVTVYVFDSDEARRMYIESDAPGSRDALGGRHGE